MLLYLNNKLKHADSKTIVLAILEFFSSLVAKTQFLHFPILNTVTKNPTFYLWCALKQTAIKLRTNNCIQIATCQKKYLIM